jgi:protein-tyrosine-phosphatase/DNA-binding transcriptional ArsR family regulator
MRSETCTPPVFLQLLADEIRWQLLAALAHGDRRVNELVALLGQPLNLVSYHLRKLREHALVRDRRSAADRRDVYYSLDLERLRRLLLAAGESLHPGLAAVPAPAAQEKDRQELGRGTRVLFLCTHNSARSQMAEGILRQLAPAVEVASAGTEATRVHPLAIRAMARQGIDISHQRSKHLSEFAGQRFDWVITVCDNAREACPLFPGDPERIHWSIPDPSAVAGSEAERYRAFEAAAVDLLGRIRLLVALIGRQPPRAPASA